MDTTELKLNLLENLSRVAAAELPIDDSDFTPDLARTVVAKLQAIIGEATEALAMSFLENAMLEAALEA
jgi:hypothetical protein